MQRTWANTQPHRSYDAYTQQLDMLVTGDVVWRPYECATVFTRAPYGLSSCCTQDSDLFRTTAALVYDIVVEAHCPNRVERQFGYAQPFPTPSAFDRVPRNEHRSVYF